LRSSSAGSASPAKLLFGLGAAAANLLDLLGHAARRFGQHAGLGRPLGGGAFMGGELAAGRLQRRCRTLEAIARRPVVRRGCL
jgi:hypothetical protein